LNENNGLDKALVNACRKLLATKIIGDQEIMHDGLSLRVAISSVYVIEGGCKSLEDFCEKFVLKMGVSAEGAHIEFGMLPMALGCKTVIEFIVPEKNGRSTLTTIVPDDKESICTLHLLYRPGHFDLLYKSVTVAEETHSDTKLGVDGHTEETHSDTKLREVVPTTINIVHEQKSSCIYDLTGDNISGTKSQEDCNNANKLINLLSVSATGANQLLTRYGSNLDFVVGQFFGLSNAQQEEYK
jgi:hypothetical protein